MFHYAALFRIVERGLPILMNPPTVTSRGALYLEVD